MKTVLRLTVLIVLILVACAAIFYENPIGVADQKVRLNLWRQGVHSRYVEVDSYRIHYFEAAPPQGTPETPLVLIHGLGSRGEDWATLIPSLASAGFHVYVPDLLGFGRSPRPDVDYSISLQEKLVADFMHTVGVSRADIGGWSMGGWVAAKLAVDHPELVDRLLLYDSAGVYFPATFDATLFTPNDKAGLDHLTEMLQPFSQPLPDFVVRAVLARLQRNAWVIDRSVSAMVNGHDILDFRLRNLQAPTMIIWGDKDVLIPPSAAESMHHLIPNSSLVFIEGCGHLAPAQCSAPVLTTTINFLRSNPPMKNVEQSLPGH